MADLLYEAELYHLARTHGYRRCLMDAGLLKAEGGVGPLEERSDNLMQYVSQGHTEPMILAMVCSS